MKGYKVTALVCWSFVALLLIWLLVTGIMGWGLFASGGPLSGMRNFAGGQNRNTSLSGGLIGEGEVSISQPVSQVQVDWVSGSVTIHSYEGSEVKWEEQSSRTLSEKQKLRYQVNNGRLTIQAYANTPWDFFGFVGNMPSKDLELWLPASVELENLSVDAASAQVKAEGFAAGEVGINTASGNITVQDVKTTELQVGTVSGWLELTGCSAEEVNLSSVSGSVDAQGMFEKVDVENVSGAIKVRSEQMISDLRVDTVSGSITITVPENEGFTLERDTVSGGLDSDFALQPRGDKYLYGDGSADFSVNSVSGGLYLKRTEDTGSTGTGRSGEND